MILTMRGLTSKTSLVMRTLFVRPGKAPVGASVRTHMTHHHHQRKKDPNLSESTSPSGPRTPGMILGLEAATGIHNILRLLESSHGPSAPPPTVTALDQNYSCWHPHAKIWRQEEEEETRSGDWKLYALTDEDVSTPAASIFRRVGPPSLLWLQFSDARTALIKLLGTDGLPRYLSLLQLDEHKPHHDGWRIVRELVSSPPATSPGSEQRRHHPTPSFVSIQQTCLEYLQLEHGGGLHDQERAEIIFHPQATLLSVGCGGGGDKKEQQPSTFTTTTTTSTNGSSSSSSNSSSSHNNPWEAPAGHFLEIPLATYLEGVMTQTIHGNEASHHDEICRIDIMPCGIAAAAVVRVGNGTQTRIFEDHLLLGRSSTTTTSQSDDWRILSKTFSPHSWPTTPSVSS
jgi:hypothetical protein